MRTLAALCLLLLAGCALPPPDQPAHFSRMGRFLGLVANCGCTDVAPDRMAAEYRKAAAAKTDLDTQVKQLKASMDVIEASMVAMMGDFLMAETAGIKVLRYSQRGNIAYKDALAVLAPELDPAQLETYRGASSERVKVTVLKAAKAQVPFDGNQVEAVRQAAEDEQGYFF
jgi:hypothetical protein